MQTPLPFMSESSNKISQIYILDASAGSGKTYNLSKRYIQLLFLQKDLPYKEVVKNILAITFTNKATIEMKQRILEFLKKIALNKISEEEKKEILNLPNKLFVNEKEYQEFAKEILDFVLVNYHDFQIQTIDSFLHQIISAYAIQLEISPVFKVETEYYEYLKYCLDLLIDLSSNNKILKKKFEKFVEKYLIWEQNRTWYPKNYILSILKTLYEETRIYGKSFVLNKTDYSKKILALCEEVIYLTEQLYNKLLVIEEKINKNFLNFLKDFIEEYKRNPLSMTTTKLSEYFQKEFIPTKKNFEVSDSLNNIWKNIRKKIAELFFIFDYTFFDSYIAIFKELEKKLNETAKKQDVIFLEELNKKIYDISSSNKYFVPELYMRLATNIKHCLVDEFQDTNVLQWNNILPILNEILSSGGTFFYVGDKKQAIYRFRGGDYKLFDDVYQKYLNGFHYEKNTLSVNRRSKKNIVEFINNVFSKENLSKFVDSLCSNEEIKEEILSVYTSSYQDVLEGNLGGYVYGEFISVQNKDAYKLILKEKILNLIKQIKQKSKNKTIAILVRKQKDAEEISEWLLEKGFSVESDKTLNVQENPFVKEIISLLRFLSSPFDNLSFASFLTGEIFLKASEIKSEEIHKFLLESANKKSFLYQVFQEEYKDIWNKFFAPLFKNFYFLPVYDLLIQLYFVFDFENNNSFQKNYAFYYHLLELAKLFEEKDCSIRYFLYKFENLKEEEKNIVTKGENVVQIITIHKAKGLEFDIVILPYFTIDIEVGKKEGPFGIRWITKVVDGGLKAIRLQKSHCEYSKELQNLYDEEYKKNLIDELNVLYVAMTRAKERLYLFLPHTKRQPNLVKVLIGLGEDKNIIEIGENNFYETSIKDQTTSTIFLEPIKHRGWYQKIVEPKVEINEIKNRAEIKEGEIIHTILSFICNLYGKNIKEEVEKAIEKSKFFFPFIDHKSTEKYKKLVLDLLEKKELKDLFFAKDAEVLCEQEIVTFNGEIKRVDRLIIQGDKVIVLDYKLSYLAEHEKLYISQVEEYKRILKEIYKDKEIIGYILFLNKLELVEV